MWQAVVLMEIHGSSVRGGTMSNESSVVEETFLAVGEEGRRH